MGNGNDEKFRSALIADICRNFNKELRRQASFKAAKERQSASRTNSPACSRYSGLIVGQVPETIDNVGRNRNTISSLLNDHILHKNNHLNFG